MDDIQNVLKQKKTVRRSSHTKHGPQPCQVCGKVFGNASALAKHKLTHSNERKYVCNTCSKAFKRQDHLNGHLLTHRHKKPFECKQEGCGKSYCDARSLRRHIDNHHKTNLTVNNTEGCATQVECSGIDRNSHISRLLTKTDKNDLTHSNMSKILFKPRTWNIQMQHDLIRPLDEIQTKNNTDANCKQAVQCNLCNRYFKNIPALNGHMRLHGGYLKRDISKFSKIKKDRLGNLTTVSVSVRALIEEKINNKKFELQHCNKTLQSKEFQYSPILMPQTNVWEDVPKKAIDNQYKPNFNVDPGTSSNKTNDAVGTLQLRHFLYPITITQTPTFPKSVCNVQIVKNNVLETRTIMVSTPKCEETNGISDGQLFHHKDIDNPTTLSIPGLCIQSNFFDDVKKLPDESQYNNNNNKNDIEENVYLYSSTPILKQIVISNEEDYHFTPPKMLLFSKTTNNEKPTIKKQMTFNGVQPKINIGKQYQADISEFETSQPPNNDYKELDLCLWSPDEIGQKELNVFLQCINSSMFTTTEEIALTVLNNDKKNPQKALLTLLTSNSKCQKSPYLEWNENEIQTFLMGLLIDGKNFSKMSTMLEQKSTKDCIQFYYSCKKLNTYRDIFQLYIKPNN